METERQKKLSRLFQKDLGEILQLEGKAWFPGAMVTVTKVHVAPDLSIARVYLSIFGKEAAQVLKVVEVHTKQVRKLLGQRIKNQVRIVPHLRFYIDDSLDYIENIENLLKG